MKKLSIILMLAMTACCSYDNQKDCTQDELKQYTELKKLETTPQFVTQKDGVLVYKIYTIEPQASNHWTYFTTPCGDVYSKIIWHEHYGKGQTRELEILANVNGTGCKVRK